MILNCWNDLPDNMRTDAIKPYYDTLSRKKCSLIVKRIFDVIMASVLVAVLSPIFLAISIAVASDGFGHIFYKQKRITTYGREFLIYKFRTMVPNADSFGSLLTISNDARITKIGRFLRNGRLDEIPQLLNIIKGDMTFVGTRPEVPKYVAQYSDEMLATLLLPAGVTSEASIFYKDEYKLLTGSDSIDEVYLTKVLPAKMRYNLEALKHFNLMNELKTIIRTVLMMVGKKYEETNCTASEMQPVNEAQKI